MRKPLIIAFLSLSMVSLFADICYEGMRSVIGSYISFLGLPIVFAGLASAAEFAGYLARFLSGLIATKFRSAKIFWGLVYVGYLTNFAVPLLALTSRWDVIILLVLTERVGKGLRTPVRDVILAELTEGIGRGKGFGIHELLDQVGAFIGPILIGWALLTTNNYQYTYSLMIIPAIISIAFLTSAYLNYPHVKAVRDVPMKGVIPHHLLLYILAISLFSLGFIHWSLIAYHIRSSGVLPDYQIALAYSIAMIADAVIAIPIGVLYDRVGLKSLLLTPLITVLIPIMLTFSDPISLTLTAVLWGITMSANETIMRAAVADLVEPASMAFAYGVFNLAIGVFWMLSSLIIAFIYSISWYLVIGFITVSEVIALILLSVLVRRSTNSM